jgi:hypothetical protein
MLGTQFSDALWGTFHVGTEFSVEEILDDHAHALELGGEVETSDESYSIVIFVSRLRFITDTDVRETHHRVGSLLSELSTLGLRSHIGKDQFISLRFLVFLLQYPTCSLEHFHIQRITNEHSIHISDGMARSQTLQE